MLIILVSHSVIYGIAMEKNGSYDYLRFPKGPDCKVWTWWALCWLTA